MLLRLRDHAAFSWEDRCIMCPLLRPRATVSGRFVGEQEVTYIN